MNQFLRCGTSIGANVYEGRYAQSTNDFISRHEIALKELNESEFWMELLYETDSMPEDDFKSLRRDCIDLRRMLTSTVTTIKNKPE